MLPPVVLHVPERDDPFAVDAVERIQPCSIVKIRDVSVMRRFVNHLAIVLRGLKARSKPRTSDVVRGNERHGSLVVSEGPGRGIWNINLLAGLLGSVERRHPRPVKKIGRWRIGSPFWTRKCKLSRARQRGVFDVAYEGDAVHEEFFALESSQQLVRERDPESVLAAQSVMALLADGGFVVQIGHPFHYVRSWRLAACGMIRIDIDGDRPSITLLASPAVYVVLVTLQRHTINDAGHRTRVRILACSS